MKTRFIPQRKEVQITGLKLLVADLPPNLVMAEIGSYAGESAAIFMESRKIKKLYCIDPWSCQDSHMQDAEKTFDGRLEKWEGAVIKLKGKINDFIDKLPELDFVYIDGKHSYSAVKNDISKSLIKLKSGGIIAGHDYSDNYKERVVKAVDELLGKPDKLYPDTSWLTKL